MSRHATHAIGSLVPIGAVTIRAEGGLSLYLNDRTGEIAVRIETVLGSRATLYMDGPSAAAARELIEQAITKSRVVVRRRARVRA